MIKIKNYILNENRIMQIDKCCNGLTIQVENGTIHIENATFEDIEWNYADQVKETQRQMQKELCKSCYCRDTISNRLEELEEENERLNTIIEEMKKFLKEGTERTCGSGITIEYIYAYENALDTLEDLIKGEYNESTQNKI